MVPQEIAPRTADAMPVPVSSIVAASSRDTSMLQVVRRRPWMALFAFIAICLIGAAVLSVVPWRYTAHTIMAVASTQPDLAATDQVVPQGYVPALREPNIESEVQLITSRGALMRVVQMLQLEQHPAFKGLTEEWQAGVPSFLRGQFPKLGLAQIWDLLTEARARPKSATLQEAIAEYVDKQLKVRQIGRSTTVDISVSAPDAAMAAELANAIAENYVEMRQLARVDQANRASSYLKERSAQLLREVTDDEKAIEAFRAGNVLSDGRDIEQLKGEMDAINVRLAAARIAEGVARTRLGAIEARIKEQGIVGALDESSALDQRLRTMEAESRTRFAAAAAQLGRSHPDVKRAGAELAAVQAEVSAEAGQRIARLKSDVVVAEQEVTMREAAMKGFRTDHSRLSGASVTIKGLERKASASRTVYESFLSRLKLTEQVGFNEAESWVIAPAVAPLNPSSPNVLLIGGVTALAAFGAALGVALLGDNKDRRTVLGEQQVAEKGLRALGIVPELSAFRSSDDSVVSRVEEETSLFSEAIGSIFTSVMELPKPALAGLVLLVTSARPLEGKSTTIMALAARMAASGKKVLLIDGDLRSPRLQQAFSLGNARGLTDCLQSDADLDSAVHVDGRTGIAILPAGKPHASPLTVLRSMALKTAVQNWRRLYDIVLIDSPAVLPTSDARILAPLADYHILVARWRRTRWTSIAHAVSLLRQSRTPLAGLVVSRVNLRQFATYDFDDSDVYARKH